MVAREDRLRRETDFERVRSRGRSWSSRLVVVIVLPNDLGRNRYGFAAGKRLGNAVRRNRAKRVLREVVRDLQSSLAQGYDMVFIARNAFVPETSYAAAREQVEGLLKRAGLRATGPEHSERTEPAGADRETTPS